MTTRPILPATRKPQRRRRALWVLAAAAPVLLMASQLRLLPQDQGVLLELAGHPVDVAGRLQGGWQQLSRRCGGVQRWPAGSGPWLAARQALADHSPPASRGARPLQVLQDASGDWLLAEVVWDGPGASAAGAPTNAPLDPAIVPLRRVGGALQVQSAGVWSGDTGPWAAPVFIRRWLQQQVPGLPTDLVLCLDPQWPVFSR
ncbi:MAG: hypothetical protein QE285_20790 [Aquabacterium sp.]|nr:hypothetical protein [Aquabacterium sp.]